MNFPWMKKTPSVSSIDAQLNEIDALIVDTNLDMIEKQNYLKMLQDKRTYLIDLKTKTEVSTSPIVSNGNTESVATA